MAFLSNPMVQGFLMGLATGIGGSVIVLLLANSLRGGYLPGPFARPDWTEYENNKAKERDARTGS